MSLAMKVVQKVLPWWEQDELPPSTITARLMKRVGLGNLVDEPEEKLAVTTLTHFGFGAAAGVPFPQVASSLPVSPVAAGMMYGFLVWMAGYLELIPAMNMLPPATKFPMGRNVMMIAAHLLWGGALGWVVERASRGTTSSSARR
jgi:uncharacterized membrane protein YagU involved in acid resistance